MKRILSSVLKGTGLFLLPFSVLGAFAQDNTTIYGSVVSSTLWNDGQGPGIYSFNTTSGTGFTPVKIDDRLSAQGGGVYAKGKYYSINADTKTLNVYDADTWELLSSKPATNVALDLAYDATTDKIYGCFVDDGSPAIGTLNPETGGYTYISVIQSPLKMLICTNDGKLYGVAESQLVSIDKKSGDFNYLGSVGIQPMYAQSATVDPTTGKCYWASMQADMTSALYEVNLSNGELTLCKSFPGMEEITGLYILPHVADGAPAKVTDLKADFNNGSTTGSVTFTMPVKTKDGKPLTGNISYRAEIGNNTKTGSATAGQKISIPASTTEGRCKVLVTTSNAAGESERAAISLWVGKDTPSAVSGLVLKRTASNGMQLSWDAVTTGAHGGYIEASKIKYRIVRKPDGKLTDNYTQTSMQDQAAGDALANYWYEVTPVLDNETGETATSNKVVTGPGKDIPYAEDFSSENSFDFFTVKDANNDGKTWYFSPYSQSVEYGGDAKQKADDWFMLPPLKVSKKGYYKLTFDARCNSENPQVISVAMGNLPETSSMTNTLMPETTISTRFETKPYEAKFGVENDGDYYLGIHIASDALMQSFDVSNIAVKQITTSDTPAKATDISVEPAAKGELKSTIGFTLPTKAIDGTELASISKAELYRGDELIKTFSDAAQVIPGKKLSFVDENPVNGFNTYKIVAYNDKGSGDDVSVTAYIGVDTPAAIKNITVDEPVDGTVNISWEAPATGANGGYIDPTKLTYTVKRNGWMTIGDNLTECSASDVVSDLGNAQQTIGYVINAVSSAGMSADSYSPYLSVGIPYETPFDESFANGMATYREWTSFPVTGDRNWSPSSNNDSEDNDQGIISFSSISSKTADLLLLSPKIHLDNTKKPMLSFYTKHSAINDNMEIEIHTHYGEPAKALSVDLSNATQGWEKHTVDLSPYSDERYIQIGFHTDNVAKGDVLYLDCISVNDNLAHNLSVTEIKAPKNIKVGTEKSVTATVRNIGTESATDYSLKLYNGDELLATQKGTELAPGNSTEVSFSVKPEVRQLPAMLLKAVVDYAADENPKNDTAKTEVALKAPTYPVAYGLNGSWNGSDVELAWKAPDLENLAPESTTDDFESLEAFSITDFGKWTATHVDGQDYSMEFKTKDGKWITYPNSGEGMSFQVIDLSQVSATEADGWSSISGNKIIISPYTGSNKDDWFISPELYGGEQTVTVNAKSLNDSGYGLESLKVYYSTSGKDVADFKLAGEIEELPDEWNEYSFKLPDGAKFFAIRANEINSALFLDDISYIPAGAPAQQFSIMGYNLYRNGALLNSTPVATTAYTDRSATAGEDYTYKVTVVYDKGESDFSEPFSLGTSGIEEATEGHTVLTVLHNLLSISGVGGQEASVWTVDGRRVFDSCGKDRVSVRLATGCYLVKIGGKTTKVMVK